MTSLWIIGVYYRKTQANVKLCKIIMGLAILYYGEENNYDKYSAHHFTLAEVLEFKLRSMFVYKLLNFHEIFSQCYVSSGFMAVYIWLRMNRPQAIQS